MLFLFFSFFLLSTLAFSDEETGTSVAINRDTEILAPMNRLRAQVCSPPLTWDPQLAQSAEQYAKSCVFAHDQNNDRRAQFYCDALKAAGRPCPNGFSNTDTKYIGENLASGLQELGAPFTAADFPRGYSWSDEKPYFTCRTNTCAPGKVCGHYTQIIWNTTQRVGCSKYLCTSGSPIPNYPTWYFLVCHFWPAGNFPRHPTLVASCSGTDCPVVGNPTPPAVQTPAPTAKPTLASIVARINSDKTSLINAFSNSIVQTASLSAVTLLSMDNVRVAQPAIAVVVRINRNIQSTSLTVAQKSTLCTIIKNKLKLDYQLTSIQKWSCSVRVSAKRTDDDGNVAFIEEEVTGELEQN